MLRKTRALWILALGLLLSAGAWYQGELTPLDVLMLKSVTGVYPSPDGATIAFTRSIPRGSEDGTGGGFTDLFMLDDAGGERPLAAGKRGIGGVSWMPDGSAITFLEHREGDVGRQLYALPMAGGEAARVFSSKLGISQYRWRPDGGAVAFSAGLPAPEARTEARSAGFRQTVYDEDWNRVGLFLWSTETGETVEIEVPGSVFGLEWSPDGSTLVLTLAARSLTDDSYMFKRIHVVELATGRVRKLVDNPGKLGQMAFSPDARRIAYVGAADERDPHAGMLFLADASTGEVTSLTPGWEGMVHSFEWMGNDRIRARISRGVESRVSDFDLRDRSWSDLPGGDFAFGSVHTASGVVVATVARGDHPNEVYALSGDSWVRRTNSNPFLDDVHLSRQEAYSFQARDGLDIEGILLYPLDFQEGERYPLVIVAHGGPESHYNNGWMTTYNGWGQLLSRAGYFVWFPNYRASTGRGVEFAKADHGDPMGGEFEDHLDAIDHFVDRGWVDRDRVGVGGGSYGGYTAAWAATRHSPHFAAAVSFVPITHVATKWLTSDIPYEFYFVHYEEVWPTDEDQWDFLNSRSPLTFAENCSTPLLLAGGTADPRVHPSQPHMLYRAVKESTETPVRYVQYPGEGHGNRVNTNRYDYMLRALRWFDHYLKPGNHRSDAPPPLDLDYSAWIGKQGG
ncbi:MAG: S9 family peptidase [Gemmatimonadetes bacterium]|nr:S9 family peptidase [Gemmatimonadota bacterium]